MEALSLLDGCQNIFEKSHGCWKSYFSKWETMAQYEEELPEEEFTGKESVPKKKAMLLKKKKRIAKKEIIRRRKKVGKKNKNKTEEKVIERSREPGNENLPEETDNKQLEMHLRTIFMDILKANKNKWEIFAVLSQTFSHGDVTIKGRHSLYPNHQRALPSNDVEVGGGGLLSKRVDFLSWHTPSTSLLYSEVRSGGVEVLETRFSTVDIRKGACSIEMPQAHDDTFKKLKPSTDRRLFHAIGTFTPPRGGKTIFDSFTCPPSLPSISRCNTIKLKPLALEFDESTPKSCRKTNNEYLCERNIPRMNITREEKRFGSLCLHKRTNCVGLNMENSNFITPERNPSERKCFSENILQRKRRRPTKLFFDFWDSSDSENDEQSESSTPRIGCRNKGHKIRVAQEVITVDPDSDECDSIFDRVKKV